MGRTRFDEPAAYARTVMVRLNIDRIRRLRRELPLLGGRRDEAPVEVVGETDAWLVEALVTLTSAAHRAACGTSRTSTRRAIADGWAARKARSRASRPAGPSRSGARARSTAREPRRERET